MKKKREGRGSGLDPSQNSVIRNSLKDTEKSFSENKGSDSKALKEIEHVSAKKILAIMDEKVVGQKLAKEQLSILLSMHLAWNHVENPRHPPPNAMLIGPTGSGKTFSIEVASEGLGVPFVKIDATTLTPTGSTEGTSVSRLVERIRDESLGKDRCVVFLDEFDKISQKKEDRNHHWKADIQKGLLKFIENQPANHNRNPKALVLAGGAFQDIRKLERKRDPEIIRLLRKAPPGTIVADDFIEYGFIPELVARIPAIIQLESLTKEILVDILKHRDSSPLKVWENHFNALDQKMIFEEEFLDEVADRAAALGLGARGLQQIVFPMIARHAFDFEANNKKEIFITKEILDYNWKIKNE